MADLEGLFSFENVRRAIVQQFGWIIHVSARSNLQSIVRDGLLASSDAVLPEEIKEFIPMRSILCLHPLGAKMSPPAVVHSVYPLPAVLEMVTFALNAKDLPRRLHLDWSFEWNYQRALIDELPETTPHEIVNRVVTEMGSFVSYDKIEPDKLRVFCEGEEPSNPSSWSVLSSASNATIHKKINWLSDDIAYPGCLS